MAAESDFDIDEVLDWDKRDYPSKDLAFDELSGLDLPTDVSVPSQSTSQAPPGPSQDNLVLQGNQLLQSQHNTASLPSQKQGTAIVTMPQMPSSSGLLNPVFPVDVPMISDIRQELMHSHAIGRSGTPPTPTFPSENFDLPPITPPASTGHLPAAFQSLGHSVISARMAGHLMSSSQAGSRRIMQSFNHPNLPSSVGAIRMARHRPNIPSSVGTMPLTQSLVASEEVMEEGSIEKLLDEIVERDMPQGVNEPIMFTSRVPEHSSAPTNPALQVNPQQMQSKSLQQAMVATSVAPSSIAHRTSMHLSSSPQSPVSMSLMNSPLNQNPGSPVAPAHTPSPNIQQIHQKASIQLRQGSQPVKLASAQMAVSSSSLGLPQPSLNTLRSSTGQSTPSQMTQQPSNQASERLSPALQSAQMIVPNRGTHNVPPLSAQSKVPATAAPLTNANTVNWKLIQGLGGVVPIKIQQGNAQSVQALKLGATINNPAVLQQIMRAVAPWMPNSGSQVKTTQATTVANSQGKQQLICYVMPQKNVSSSTVANQTQQKVSGTSTSPPVKMFLINADKTLMSKSQLAPTQTVSTSVASRIQLPIGMNTQSLLMKDKSVSSPLQVGVKVINPSNSQCTPETMPPYTVGHQLPSVTSVQPQGTSQTKQQVQSAPAVGQLFNAHSNPLMTMAPPSLGVSSTSTSTASSLGASMTGNIVPITFVNEATIGRVVAFTPTVTTVHAISTPLTSTTAAATSSTQVTSSAFVSTQASVTHVDSDDDDSKPLAQVVQSMKKMTEKKTKKRGTKRKKKKKEAEEPSKTHSAYQIFFKETQAAIRQQKPMAQFDDIAKIVSHMWEKLSEDQKKMYADKARIEHQKAVEETKAQKNSNVEEQVQSGVPSHKQRKTDTTGVVASALGEPQIVPPSNGSSAAVLQPTTLSTPVESLPSTTPTVTTTTVLPGTKSKKAASTDGSLKSKKKNKVSVNPISQRICVREACNMPARTTKDRGTQYCSNECIVRHCSMVFKNWVQQRKAEAQMV